MSDHIRERLERIKRRDSPVNLPLSKEELNQESIKKLITPESEYMKKVDKLATQIINLRRKMHTDSGQYLSLYHDLKKAETEFLAILDDPEKQFMDLPEFWLQKIEDLKQKILAKKK